MSEFLNDIFLCTIPSSWFAIDVKADLDEGNGYFRKAINPLGLNANFGSSHIDIRIRKDTMLTAVLVSCSICKCNWRIADYGSCNACKGLIRSFRCGLHSSLQ